MSSTYLTPAKEQTVLGVIGILVIIELLFIAVYLVACPPARKQDSKTLVYPRKVTLQMDSVRVTVRIHLYCAHFMSFGCVVDGEHSQSLIEESPYVVDTTHGPFPILRSDNMRPDVKPLLEGYEVVGVRTGHKEARLTLRRVESDPAAA